MSGVIIRINSEKEINLVKDQLLKEFSKSSIDLDVIDFKESGKLYFQVVLILKSVIIVVFVLIFFLIFVTVNGLMSRLVRSRKREIGNYQVLGLTIKQVKKIFAAEVILSFIKSILFTLMLGSLIMYILALKGIDGIFLLPNDHLNLRISFESYLITTTYLFAISIMSCLISFNSLKKFEILELIKDRGL